tara:strand:- start:4789 stop:5580 length:792 start_codon:yes stop_codon:yes gene_type:complete
MKKGFVIFTDLNYFPIVENLIDSVLLFSKYNIELNCINFLKEFDNPRIKSKKIDMPNPHFFNITRCKIIATINSNFDYGLLLDGDMIVTKEIDQIFNDNEEKIKKVKCPLFCKHPHNPFERYKHIFEKLTNKEPKMNYVYSVYLFLKSQKWFFEETLSIMNNILSKNRHNYFYPIPEESVLNAQLCNYDVDYDMGYCYHINGFSECFEYYLNPESEEGKKGKKHIEDTYLSYDCPIKIYAFHGHNIKDINIGKNLINKIKLRM